MQRNNVLANLQQTREELLREFILTSGGGKAEVLTKILEIDEQIEEEKSRMSAV